MKVYRLEEAAERLGLSPQILEIFEAEGRIASQEKIGGIPYYSQVALDRLIHELHCSMQRASWSDLEKRMQSVEQQLEDIGRELKRMRENSSRLM